METTRSAGAAIAALALVFLPSPYASAQEGPLDHEIIAGETGVRLDELASRYAAWGFAGTILVARGGEVLLHKGYGLADRERGIANTVDTRHPALSVTKPMLAMAVMRLAERGALDLEEPLSTYLGPFPDAKRTATLHHLLTHTAGLAARGSDVGRPERSAFVQAMKEAPFESPPGEERRYSNAGYSLVAAVVEEVTGRRWEQVVRDEVFVTAALADSAFTTDPDAPATAIGYAGEVHTPRAMTLADGPPAMAELWWGAAGAAGVDGTVADLYRWMQAVASGDLIESASSERVFTAHIGDQGYGWHVDKAPDGSTRRWKGGGLPMHESKVAWYPDRDVMILFAINNHFGWRVPLWSGIETVLFGGEVTVPPLPLPLAAGDEWERLNGSYRLSDGGLFEIVAGPEWLTLTAADEKAAGGLGFEGRQKREGAVLATRPIAAGVAAGVQLTPGRAAVPVVELRSPDPAADDEALTLVVGGRAPRVAVRVSKGVGGEPSGS